MSRARPKYETDAKIQSGLTEYEKFAESYETVKKQMGPNQSLKEVNCNQSGD